MSAGRTLSSPQVPCTAATALALGHARLWSLHQVLNSFPLKPYSLCVSRKLECPVSNKGFALGDHQPADGRIGLGSGFNVQGVF